MEIRHLKMIKVVAEEGSITKAMVKLHLTQSALSHQLREAESRIGTRIFERQRKSMQLTRAGIKLYDTANEILRQLQQAEIEIKNIIATHEGEIKLSGECYTGSHWYPSVMRTFQNFYPNVQLNMVVGATHFPIRKLLAGELDLAVVTSVVQNERVRYVELFEDEIVAVIPVGHKWSQKSWVAPEDFRDERLFIHSYPLENVLFHEHFLKPAGITPQKISAIPIVETALEMVKQQMGVMVMAQWSLKPYMNDKSVTLLKLGPNGLRRKHYLAMLNQHSFPPFFEAFLEILIKEFSRIESAVQS